MKIRWVIYVVPGWMGARRSAVRVNQNKPLRERYNYVLRESPFGPSLFNTRDAATPAVNEIRSIANSGLQDVQIIPRRVG